MQTVRTQHPLHQKKKQVKQTILTTSAIRGKIFHLNNINHSINCVETWSQTIGRYSSCLQNMTKYEIRLRNNNLPIKKIAIL